MKFLAQAQILGGGTSSETKTATVVGTDYTSESDSTTSSSPVITKEQLSAYSGKEITKMVVSAVVSEANSSVSDWWHNVYTGTDWSNPLELKWIAADSPYKTEAASATFISAALESGIYAGAKSGLKLSSITVTITYTE